MHDGMVIADLVESQHGLVTPAQLWERGVPDETVRRRIEQRRLVEMSPRVLRVAGSARTLHQQLLAAVLDAGEGAALARSTALALWGLPGFAFDPAHVVRPLVRNGVHPELSASHVTRDLRPHHLVELHRIPCCTVARALVDVAGELHYERLARVCDQAWSRRLLTAVGLHAIVRELAGRGRAGSGALRRLVAERPVTYRPPDSNLEARVMRILADAGDPPLQRQVDLGDGDWIGRVDFLDGPLRIVFEVQSDMFHSSVTDRRRDEERQARLRAAGWRVEELVEFDVWYRPGRIVEAVRRARQEARKLLPAA